VAVRREVTAALASGPTAHCRNGAACGPITAVKRAAGNAAVTLSSATTVADPRPYRFVTPTARTAANAVAVLMPPESSQAPAPTSLPSP
jgi:hypothetical protein